MVGDLLAYATLVLACPVMWGVQRIHDWWSNPTRAYYRGVWVAEHTHPHLIHRLQAGTSPAWIRGAAVTTPASSLTPASSPSVGAGPKPRSTSMPPTSTSTGPQPRNRGEQVGHESGASDPETGAPVRGAA